MKSKNCDLEKGLSIAHADTGSHCHIAIYVKSSVTLNLCMALDSIQRFDLSIIDMKYRNKFVTFIKVIGYLGNIYNFVVFRSLFLLLRNC